MYRIERQDQLYKTLPRALFFSPTIVAFSAFTLLLPLSGVFAPGSLTVITQNLSQDRPCEIPTGNLSNASVVDYGTLFTTDDSGVWSGPTGRATALATQCFLEHRIPDLPQACGPNCRYKVSVPSFVFQCTPNPPSLPYGQTDFSFTFWNGTTDPTSKLAFYVAWRSNGQSGTSGNASCSPVQAQYDIKVCTMTLFTQCLADFLMSNQGRDQKGSSICYDKYQCNNLSYPRHCTSSIIRRKGHLLASACIYFICNTGTFPWQYHYLRD